MEEYQFEHKEPLTHEIVLALKVDIQQKQEQLWLGARKNSLYLAQMRPLGVFCCEFGKISAEGGGRMLFGHLAGR